MPIQAEMNEKLFKLLFLDVGLMNAVLGMNWLSIARISDTALVNGGQVAEQFIGQHLLEILSSTSNRQLTYWLRDGKAQNEEVDYVIAINGLIIPNEVKAGTSGSLRSLHEFMPPIFKYCLDNTWVRISDTKRILSDLYQNQINAYNASLLKPKPA